MHYTRSVLHCTFVESGKTILLCIYCEKLIRGGGIHRFKLHLARKGGDVESCRKVPAAVRHQFHESIEELRSKKRKTQEQYAESYNACDDVKREFDEIERNEMQQQQKSKVPTPISRKGKQVKGLQSYFPSAKTPGAQPTIKSVLQSKEIVEKCDIAIAKWMVDASVPFNAVNSAYYQPMIDVIASMGAGYKGPSYPRVRGYLLSKLVEDVRKMIDGYREIWKQTGCTIMADGWTDHCCERNWSIFEHIHSKKRNRLKHQKLNDLVYVHYNLRLQQRNQMRNQIYDPICLDVFEDHSEWILEDSPPFLTPEEIDAL
ncbi:hypothetical protein AHAS_Ahas02G0123700 [Arachis hypogaea]